MMVSVQDGRYEIQVEYGYNELGRLNVEVWGAVEVVDGMRRQLPPEVACVLAAEYGERCYEEVVWRLAEQELAHRIMLDTPETMQ